MSEKVLNRIIKSYRFKDEGRGPEEQFGEGVTNFDENQKRVLIRDHVLIANRALHDIILWGLVYNDKADLGPKMKQEVDDAIDRIAGHLNAVKELLG